MIDKCRYFGLKGQNISAQGNALGNLLRIKTVRDMPFKNDENFFRTEMRMSLMMKRDFRQFRPKPLKFFELLHRADDFLGWQLTPGDARGYYNFSLSGIRLYF